MKDKELQKEIERNRKHLYWVIGLIIMTIILCATLIWINYNSWTIRFEMDNNTLEAIKSINWSNRFQNQDSSGFNLNCCYPLDCPESINNPDNCNCVYAVKCEYIENE